MSSSATLVVIPARMGSSRFPGKVLAPLGPLPVVEWCRRAAVAAGVGPVVVATDSARVREAVRSFGGAAVLTPRSCRSGTDRVRAAAAALERVRGKAFKAVVNLQGDEPFIRPATIRAVSGLLKAPAGPDIATAVVRSRDARRAADPHVVKAVLAGDGRCLYFSRSAVPYANGSAPAEFFEHIGIYGFRREALERFVRLPPSRLEARERLEQLRALEAGMTIAAARARERTVAIDVPGDLRRARLLLKEGVKPLNGGPHG